MHSKHMPGECTAVYRTALTATLCATLAFGMVPAPALADDGATTSAVGAASTSQANQVKKTQVVYVKQSATGQPEGVYVVNQFEGPAGVLASDAGTYVSVKNLSDEQELDAAGTSAFTMPDTGLFLYQGNLASTTVLPWNVDVSYMLDGIAMQPDDLAGKSGHLSMKFSVSPNSEYTGNYADNYLLQVTCNLDNDLASNIQADDATSAQETGTTRLSYMVFPGKSAQYEIDADVVDFEFAGFQVVGVPLSLALDVDDSQFEDASSKLDSLEEACEQLDDGASQLSDGSRQLVSGTESANAGAHELSQGAQSVDAGAANLSAGAQAAASGANSLSTAATSIDEGASSLSSSLSAYADKGSQLVAGSQAYESALTQKAQALESQASSTDVASAKAAYQQAMQTYTASFAVAFAQAQASGLSQNQALSAAQEATASQAKAVESALTALVTAQATVSGSQAAADALNQAAANHADLSSALSSYVDTAQSLAQGAATLSDGTRQLAQGADSLSDGTASLASGTSELYAGTTALSQGSSSLEAGTSTLVQGSKDLSSGASSLAQGTGELASQTHGMSQKMIDAVRDQIASYLDPSFTLVDFVNGEEDSIERVQFVYKTKGIEIPDDEAEKPQEQVEEQGFFQKLMALFG